MKIQNGGDNTNEQLSAYIRLSDLYIAQRKYSETENLLVPLTKKNRGPNHKLDRLSCYLYLNLTTAYYRKGEFHQAAQTLDVINRHIPKASQELMSVFVLLGNIWANMPAAYQDEGYGKALYYFKLAEPLARLEKKKNNLAAILNNEGDVYLKLKNWRKCEEKLRESIATCRENNLSILQPVLLTLGEAYYAQGKYKEALFYLEQVHRIKSKEDYYAYCTLKLAQTHMGMKHYKDVEPLLREVEYIAKNEHRSELLMQTYKLQSELENIKGNYKHALVLYKSYTTLQDSLLGKNAVTALQELDLKFRTSEANRKLLERQLFIKKQKQLLQQKNLQILILTFTIIIIAILLLTLYSRRKHKKKLLMQNTRIDLLKATVSGEERERERIAQELHDGIGGMLAVVNMNLQTAQRDGFRNEHHNNKILQMISAISADVRKTAHNLLPAALEEHGLVNAIKILCEDVSNDNACITIDLEVDGDIAKLEKTSNINIYRIIQELIQNILKHSGATHIVVVMESDNNTLTINVDDNGRGYDLELVEQKCLGLRNIRERVSGLSGALHIRSEIGIGTSVNMLFKNIT